MTRPDIPRCGDHVLHRPSGETWVVAYADPATDDLAWAGWPNGLARLSDCEIVHRCTDAEHRLQVEAWAGTPDDSRSSRVLRRYGEATHG